MAEQKYIYVKPAVYSKLEEQMMEEKAELAAHRRAQAIAAEQGDLRENSEYELATERCAIAESRINSLRKVMQNIRVDNSWEEKIYHYVEPMTEVRLERVNSSTGQKLTDEWIYVVIDALGDIGEIDEQGNQISLDKVSIDSSFGRVIVNKALEDAVTYSGIRYVIAEIKEIDYSKFFGGE